MEIFKLNSLQMLFVMMILGGALGMGGYYAILEKVGVFGAICPISGFGSTWANAVLNGMEQGNMFAFNPFYRNIIIIWGGGWIISVLCARYLRKHW